MKTLTIVYTTGRLESKLGWFLESLARQAPGGWWPERLVVVDVHGPEFHSLKNGDGTHCVHTRPKPTIWQGPHRVMKQNWWAMSNARNTGLCLADTEWVAFLDDRCVLLPTWLEALREAMEGGYAVFGSYEKRDGMRVERGEIVEDGTVTGRDNRLEHLKTITAEWHRPHECGGQWCYGCSVALPVEWALAQGGFEQAMDGLGFEDVIFGLMLGNNGRPMRYDARFGIVEDRSAQACGAVFRREDKGVSPNDKSHASLERFGKAVKTTNHEHLMRSRDAVQLGLHFPTLLDPAEDWWDGEDVRKMEVEAP